jgi:hypothetical protein
MISSALGLFISVLILTECFRLLDPPNHLMLMQASAVCQAAISAGRKKAPDTISSPLIY